MNGFEFGGKTEGPTPCQPTLKPRITVVGICSFTTRHMTARRDASPSGSPAGLPSGESPVSLQDLATSFPTAEQLAEARLATIVSAVRYGRHLPEGRRFLSLYRSLRAPPPLAFLSVCLAARKPGRDTAEGNPYLRKALPAINSPQPSPWLSPDGWIIRATAGWTGK